MPLENLAQHLIIKGEIKKLQRRACQRQPILELLFKRIHAKIPPLEMHNSSARFELQIKKNAEGMGRGSCRAVVAESAQLNRSGSAGASPSKSKPTRFIGSKRKPPSIRPG